MFGLEPQRDRVSRAPDDRDGGRWVVFGALTRSVLDTGVILDVLSSQERGETAFVDVEGGEPHRRLRPQRTLGSPPRVAVGPAPGNHVCSLGARSP